jgi:putative ABC transport system ATP-binding protein
MPSRSSAQSGSGKSTLLSLLAGLGYADHRHGAASTARRCPRSMRTGARRCAARKVGFVFQSFQLLPTLTALENVMLPLELRGDADADGPARRILEKVGLGQRLRHYPKQLSGGEHSAWRLRAPSSRSPRCCSPTSPTGNLDTHTGQAIIDLLFALNADAGTTLVLVTHDEHLAARCRHAIRLDSGRRVDA